MVELYNSDLSGVIILNTLNIIFAEVGACLDFYEYQLFTTGVTNPMKLTSFNVHGFTRKFCEGLTIDDLPALKQQIFEIINDELWKQHGLEKN